MKIKKIAALILEINDASFAWYVFATIIIIGVDRVYPSISSSYGGVWLTYWLMGISTVLKIISILGKRQYKETKERSVVRKSITRLKSIAFSLIGSLLLIWSLFSYQGNTDIYRTLGASGMHPLFSAFLLFLLYWCVIIHTVTAKEMEESAHTETEIKEIYAGRREHGNDERLSALFPLRSHAHATEYASITAYVCEGERILDAGCGDGSLALLLAQKGAVVTACDISPENIRVAKERAHTTKITGEIHFIVADAEALPFPDNSFDCVVSSHVLEHLPHFEKGLTEIKRVTKKRAIIAMPTCMNPCAAVILGGDIFWTISRWSATAWFVGLLRIILNFGGEGVDERYAGDERLPHVWRYPWVMRRELASAGFHIIFFEASSLCLPYVNALIPLIKKIERYKSLPILRNFGYGSIAVVEK